ncbi:probable palmitoyltransferase ZDHHC24 [Dreissena polymorpha]|uniref:probable palmitoyltransferase ZDHHC24 n=1 Tax=Dreissena polymorpha TaxID=45954 RepID=UPI00226515FB|nr:probable palmitoyltransferase ZDHHC24 [Dreissena polymorpha]
MDRFLSVLKRPNKLQDRTEGTRQSLMWYLTSTRGQIKLLHVFAVSYVIIFCFLVCWASVTLGLPVVLQDSPTLLTCSQGLMIYLCFCIEANFLLIKYRAKDSHVLESSYGLLPMKHMNKVKQVEQYACNKSSNGTVESDWRICSHCNVQVPPRARHCSICQTCVLKKDHHCFFTGCCIGFYNQRYFITFCVLGMVGGSWGLYNLGTYLSTHYAAFFSLQIYKYFLPYMVLSALLGYQSFYELFLVMLFFCHITSTATSYYYFVWQMCIIQRGQTSYEYMTNIRIYEPNFWSGMKSVFGPYWLAGFFVPIPFIVNEGDGKSWMSKTKSM